MALVSCFPSHSIIPSICGGVTQGAVLLLMSDPITYDHGFRTTDINIDFIGIMYRFHHVNYTYRKPDRLEIWQASLQVFLRVVHHAMFNTLGPRQNGRHFAADALQCINLNENVYI